MYERRSMVFLRSRRANYAVIMSKSGIMSKPRRLMQWKLADLLVNAVRSECFMVSIKHCKFV